MRLRTQRIKLQLGRDVLRVAVTTAQLRRSNAGQSIIGPCAFRFALRTLPEVCREVAPVLLDTESQTSCFERAQLRLSRPQCPCGP